MTQLSSLTIHTDGGARGNPGPAGTGFVVTDQNDREIIAKGQYIGVATNNVAEYQAVIHALTWILNSPKLDDIEKLTFYLDSNLVVNQLSGNYKIKTPHIRELVDQVNKIVKEIDKPISYHHVPREKNKDADALVNQAIDAYTN